MTDAAKVLIKYRSYQGLWLAIAGASADKPIKVECHRRFARRLIQAVRKEKSMANNTRKQLDMPRYGKMTSVIVSVDKVNVSIEFSLSYNGDQL